MDGEATLSADGGFEISVEGPEMLRPGVWFMLMLDLDRDGFDEFDIHSGGYHGNRLEAGRGPYHLTVKERPPAGPSPTPAVARPPSPSPTATAGPAFAALAEGFFNVKDFGARGNGTGDDTAAIQAAIQKAAEIGGVVYLPPGGYPVRSLDLTNRHRISLIGAGPLSSKLIAIGEDIHMLDMTGAMYVRIENLQIASGSVVPATAILLGQNDRWSANANHLMNLYVSGKFRVATIYVHGSQSSDMMNCDIYNYQPTDAPVVAFTANNYAGVSSTYTETIQTQVTTSDWTIVACEMHSFAAQYGGPSEAPTVRLDGTMQMRWVGGNISGSGPEYVRFSGAPTHTIFDGTTFYSDNGTPTKSVFYNSDRVTGLTVNQCVLQSSDSVFGGAPDAVYDVLSVCSPTMGQAAFIDCPRGLLTNSLLHCNGLGLRVGTVQTTFLINPGTVTAQTDGAFKLVPHEAGSQ